MLVLTRKVDQKLMLVVNGAVLATVTLCTADRGRSRIGIEADPHIVVWREELLEKALRRPEPSNSTLI